jgi:crotonobetainyl-CoA:carnitine CoA-transferase CaiB-like acyl-CoA transferase
MSDCPPVYRGAPPRVGEHSDEVLGEVLGLSSERIAALRAAGVI